MELQNRNTTALTSTSHEQAIAVLLQEGFRQHKQGDLAAAQASYEAILACDAYHFDALQLLGTVFFAKSKFEEALDLLDSALSQRPDVAPVHNNVGSCLKSLGRFNDALESFNRAIDLDKILQMRITTKQMCSGGWDTQLRQWIVLGMRLE